MHSLCSSVRVLSASGTSLFYCYKVYTSDNSIAACVRSALTTMLPHTAWADVSNPTRCAACSCSVHSPLRTAARAVIQDYYQKLGMGDVAPTYDFPPGEAPDAVVIDLGTNDFVKRPKSGAAAIAAFDKAFTVRLTTTPPCKLEYALSYCVVS